MSPLFSIRSPFDRMIRLARSGAELLDATARRDIAAFLLSRQQADGGFRGAGTRSDLYYTLFALAGLQALDTTPANPTPWLDSFGDGKGLDLVHLGALAVCRSLIPGKPSPEWRQAICARLEAFRQPDGGFADEPDCQHGTPYGAYLAILAAGALGQRLPRRGHALAAARLCQTRDGGFAGRPGAAVGTIPATVAMLILNALDWRRPNRQALAWFERCRRGQVFAAAPDAPLPDLLSTATVLAANRLIHLHLPVDRKATATFVESCWDETGGFGAVPAAPPDNEYTFYALLALGAIA
ncbi:MAG: prenyltransferase/squalene oxidase repeat-containing protein [Lentisphaeria bacterium]|jgi:prenyltransferase beta subunit|nr:prenyltransferase/squalene oxidase repeat-containing protein [Lentisphaeria bacterium]